DPPGRVGVPGGRGAAGVPERVRATASFRHIITRDRVSRAHLVAAGQVAGDKATILASERLITAMNALAQTYDRLIIDAGSLSDAVLSRVARLAPHVVLTAPGSGDEVITPMRARLTAAGFEHVTPFVGVPPRPDAPAGASPQAA